MGAARGGRDRRPRRGEKAECRDLRWKPQVLAPPLAKESSKAMPAEGEREGPEKKALGAAGAEDEDDLIQEEDGAHDDPFQKQHLKVWTRGGRLDELARERGWSFFLRRSPSPRRATVHFVPLSSLSFFALFRFKRMFPEGNPAPDAVNNSFVRKEIRDPHLRAGRWHKRRSGRSPHRRRFSETSRPSSRRNHKYRTPVASSYSNAGTMNIEPSRISTRTRIASTKTPNRYSNAYRLFYSKTHNFYSNADPLQFKIWGLNAKRPHTTPSPSAEV